MFHKRTFKVLSNLILLAVFCTGQVAAAPNNNANVINNAPRAESVSTAPTSSSIMFIENVGQMSDGARFQVRGGDGTIWLAENALWVTVLEKSSSAESPSLAGGKEESLLPFNNGEISVGEDNPRQGVNIKLSFPGSNPNPSIEPFNRLETSVNYFIGKDPAKWNTDVPVWGGVRYKELYPGIDLEITGENGQVVQRVMAPMWTQCACKWMAQTA